MNSNQSKVSDIACEECGLVLPQADTVLIQRSRVCAACKPLFLQKLVEGAPSAGHGTTIWLRVMIFIGAVYVLYGLYALEESRRNPQVLGIMLAFISVAGGLGLMLNRRWSRYCIWLVSITLTGTWIYFVTLLAMRAWPFNTWLESVISLVPGLLMILVLAASSYFVRKHFGTASAKTLGAKT